MVLLGTLIHDSDQLTSRDTRRLAGPPVLQLDARNLGLQKTTHLMRFLYEPFDDQAGYSKYETNDENKKQLSSEQGVV